MKVAISFPGCHRRGGVERIVLECARFLVARDHEVHVFASEYDAGPSDDISRRIKFRPVPRSPVPKLLSGLAYYRDCARALAGEHFDVINSHGCVCPTGGVMWAQSIHASWLEQSRRTRPAMSASRWKQCLNPLHPILLRLEQEHFGRRRYRKVIATTVAVRADLLRFYGVPEEDVTIVPNGFSPQEFNPERRAHNRKAARQRLGIAVDKIVLLFVANELERKGYATVIDAMKRLRRTDVHLLLAGRTNVEKAMRIADTAGVADQVRHVGPSSDIGLLHAAADLFVLPTQYEAFCLAILEALGSGLPVITSAVPGAHDAILPGVNGGIVKDPLDGSELAESLRPFMEADFRLSVSQKTPATVSAYQWPNVLPRYEAVLEACAGLIPAHQPSPIQVNTTPTPRVGSLKAS